MEFADEYVYLLFLLDWCSQSRQFDRRLFYIHFPLVVMRFGQVTVSRRCSICQIRVLSVKGNIYTSINHLLTTVRQEVYNSDMRTPLRSLISYETFHYFNSNMDTFLVFINFDRFFPFFCTSLCTFIFIFLSSFCHIFGTFTFLFPHCSCILLFQIIFLSFLLRFLFSSLSRLYFSSFLYYARAYTLFSIF